MNRRALVALAAPAALIASLVPANAAPSGPATTAAPQHVIVQLSGTPALSAGPQAAQRTAALHTDHTSLAKAASVKVTHDFTQLINAVAVTTDAAGVARLRAQPGVVGVFPDAEMHASVDPDVSQIGAPEVWKTDDPSGRPDQGTGETIAVIDTGIDYRDADLGGGFGPGHKVVGGYDFVNGDADPLDDNGHGTHVAGIIAGDAATPSGRTGVAPKADLTAYKVFDQSGGGAESTVIEGLEAAVAPDNPHRADVVNLSLTGPPTPDDPLEQACEDAIKAGVVVVAAAGNWGPGTSTVGSPAEAPDVLAVGASATGVQVPTLTVTSPVNHQMDVARLDLSANPPAAGEDLDLVDVGSGVNESDYDGKDVAGRAVFVHSSAEAWALSGEKLAQEHGAAAVVFSGVNIYGSAGQPGPLVHVAAGPADDPDKLNVVAVEANGTDAADLAGWLDQGPVTIHIGSSDVTDQLASFSSHGPALGSYALKPDLVAPGVEIGSTWLDGGYADESGTSMAAPHVAGAAALLREAHPGWTAAQISAALTSSSKLLPGYDATAVGAGRLDVAAADQLSVLPDQRVANLGLADLSKSKLNATTTVTLTNTGSHLLVAHLSVRQAPSSHAKVQVSPSVAVLPAHGTLKVELSIGGTTPATSTDITGWLQARVGTSELTVPYLLAVRPLQLHASPDPTASASTVYLYSEAGLASTPKVTITGPNHKATTVAATYDHPGWWRLAVPAGTAGTYQLTAKARAQSGVTLTGTLALEELGTKHPNDWQSVGPDSTGAGQVAYTGKPGRIYATPDTLYHPVLFRTDDGGANWTESKSMPVGDGVDYGLAADPTDPDTVYLGVRGDRYGDPTYGGKLLVSHDAGDSWTTLPYPDVPPSDLTIDPTGNDLVVTPEDGDPIVSTDRGQTWTSYPTPEGYDYQARIVGHDLYIATGTNLYVVRNVDSDPAPMQTLLSSTLPYDWMTGISAEGTTLVAHSTQQVFVSHDAGASWRTVFTAAQFDSITSAQSVHGQLYVGGYHGISHSTDDGATWTAMPTPPAVDTHSTAEYAVGSGPNDSDLVVNVVGTGMWRTSDQGATYQRIGLPAADVDALAVNQDAAGQTQLIAATMHSTFGTTLPTGAANAATRDWGINGAEDLIGVRVYTMAADPTDPKIVYRATVNAQGRLGIQRSDDSGVTWNGVAASHSPSHPNQLVVDPVDHNIVYLTVSDSISNGVMVSRDGGHTWRDNQVSVSVTAIVADPTLPNRIWLGGPGGLYRSDDQGQTVAQLSSTPVTALAVDPKDADHLLIGGQGLYESHDGGHTVTAAKTISARLNIDQLAIGPDGTVYAADSTYTDPSGLPVGGRGVLVSHDGGRSYTSLSAGLPDLNVQSLAVSPDGGWLYAGTSGGSVYRLAVN